jgi:predicted ester cyclase
MKGSRMTLEETNKAVVRRYIEEVINENKVEVIDELFVPDMREQVRSYLSRGDDPFPDGHEEIKDIVAEGDTVMVRWNFKGTHTGTYLEIPATGKSIEMIGFAVYYLENEQIVDDLMLMSNCGALKQMGVTFTPSTRWSVSREVAEET